MDQTPIMQLGSNGNRFDWERVLACAREPIKAPKIEECGALGMLSAAYKRYEADFHRINSCRLAIIARHEGWREAAPDLPDPMPEVPYISPDDFKS